MAVGVSGTPELGLLIFNDKSKEAIFQALGYEVSPTGYLIREGVTLRCVCCDRALRPGDFGAALPGSPLEPYCDNTSCFANYVQSTFERKRT